MVNWRWRCLGGDNALQGAVGGMACNVGGRRGHSLWRGGLCSAVGIPMWMLRRLWRQEMRRSVEGVWFFFQISFKKILTWLTYRMSTTLRERPRIKTTKRKEAPWQHVQISNDSAATSDRHDGSGESLTQPNLTGTTLRERPHMMERKSPMAARAERLGSTPTSDLDFVCVGGL